MVGTRSQVKVNNSESGCVGIHKSDTRSNQLEVDARVRFSQSRTTRRDDTTKVRVRFSVQSVVVGIGVANWGSCTKVRSGLGQARLDMPLMLDSPAGGLGGPAPPVKEWVTRRGSPNPPGSGTTTRSAAEEEEAMWGGSQYVVGRAQHCGRWTRLASAVCRHR